MAKPAILATNIFDNEALTATDTDSGSQYDVDNVIDGRPYTRWKAASSGDKSIVMASDTTNPRCDAIAIVGHNLFTAGSDVEVQVFRSAAWLTVGGPWTPTSDDALFFQTFTSDIDNDWRILFENSTAPIEIGVLILGEMMEFPRYLEGAFDPESQRIEAEQSTSQTGELLGSTIRYREHNITASFTRLTDAFIRDTYTPLWNTHLSQLKPFIFAWNPTGTTLADSQFVSMTPSAQLQVPYDPTRRSLSLQMRGIVRP